MLHPLPRQFKCRVCTEWIYEHEVEEVYLEVPDPQTGEIRKQYGTVHKLRHRPMLCGPIKHQADHRAFFTLD